MTTPSDDDAAENPRPSAWLRPSRASAADDKTEDMSTPEEPPTGNGDVPPEPVAVDDEPTVRRPMPDLGGETVRLSATDDEPTIRRPMPNLGGETVRIGSGDVGPGSETNRPAGVGPGSETNRLADLGAAAEASRPADLGAAAEASRPAEESPAVVGRVGESGSGGETSRHGSSAAEGGGGGSAGSLEPVIEVGSASGAVAVPEKDLAEAGKSRKVSSAAALIAVLLALFGFTLVVQLRSNDADQGLATARQEDLVAILSDLESRDTRLSAEISALEQSQRQLTSGVAGRQAALAEADKRADELGLLAGTLPGRGPGLKIVIDPKGGQVKASAVLNAVQELRGAGGEVMELVGADGTAVRIVASTYFVDAGNGVINADNARVGGPYTLLVIGQPQTMQTALQIPGGVVASVESAGGSVTMEQSSLVEVAAVRKATDLQYARPVS